MLSRDLTLALGLITVQYIKMIGAIPHITQAYIQLKLLLRLACSQKQQKCWSHLRGSLHETGTNSGRYEFVIFAVVYMRPGGNASSVI